MSLEHLADAEEFLEIKVADTGIGISDEDKKHIFDRFYQTEHKGMEEATGTGIGLSLVRDFVTLHEGTVEVFDNGGTGTVFVVRLPVKHVDVAASLPVVPEMFDEGTSSSEDTGQVETERGRFPLLLVVDDNPDFREFMSATLGLQYRIRTASNGKEAWEMMQENELPDLVVSDVMMPEMDGIELLERVKEDISTCHIPVILLTAKTDDSAQTEGYMAGADAYIAKPFNARNLELLVQNIQKGRERNIERFRHAEELNVNKIVNNPKDERLMNDLVDLILENLGNENFSVTDITEALRISRSRLHIKVKALTGIPITQFIRTIRIREAKKLLLDGMNVAETSYAVGYSDPNYFTKTFRAETGMTPTEFVKSRRP